MIRETGLYWKCPKCKEMVDAGRVQCPKCGYIQSIPAKEV